MSKFLNTSATTYHLEELIKNAQERVFIVSPYLKLNDKVKELLEDKNRLKIDIRIIYGKTELNPKETDWLSNLEYVRLSFCKNLHAKCYMSEAEGIITSLNMYEFSQVNNNEMGVLFSLEHDKELYNDCMAEVKRIIRISEEVRMNMEIVQEEPQTSNGVSTPPSLDSTPEYPKISTNEIAKKLNRDSKDILKQLITLNLVELKGQNHYLTTKGKTEFGGIPKKLYGKYYFLWDHSVIEILK